MRKRRAVGGACSRTTFRKTLWSEKLFRKQCFRCEAVSGIVMVRLAGWTIPDCDVPGIWESIGLLSDAFVVCLAVLCWECSFFSRTPMSLNVDKIDCVTAGIISSNSAVDVRVLEGGGDRYWLVDFRLLIWIRLISAWMPYPFYMCLSTQNITIYGKCMYPRIVKITLQ